MTTAQSAVRRPHGTRPWSTGHAEGPRLHRAPCQVCEAATHRTGPAAPTPATSHRGRRRRRLPAPDRTKALLLTAYRSHPDGLTDGGSGADRRRPPRAASTRSGAASSGTPCSSFLAIDPATGQGLTRTGSRRRPPDRVPGGAPVTRHRPLPGRRLPSPSWVSPRGYAYDVGPVGRRHAPTPPTSPPPGPRPAAPRRPRAGTGIRPHDAPVPPPFPEGGPAA